MKKCTRCGKEFENYDQLRRHVGRLHKVDSRAFYVEHYLNGVWPTCKCGCGEKVKWDAENKKFRDYAQGHQSRVNNNWGNNPEALKRSLETRRTRFASGEITTWNSGLTKETDERVAANSEARARAFTTEVRSQYANTMRENRLNGTVPTLSGADHPQWKGGVSTINQLARADRRLYTDWKYPILERDGFKCTKCGNTHDLHVHHDKKTFSEIMSEVITDDDLQNVDDNAVKRSLVDRITDYHIKNLVSGVTLCHDCHAELHPSLNFK